MARTDIDVGAFLESVELAAGSHTPDGKYCVMEAVAYIAREPWSDHPECVSPAIAAFMRSWNDSLDTANRQRLKPYILKVIGTRTTTEDEERRAWLATDWLVRTFAPAWLDLAKLDDHAAALRALPELSTTELADAAIPVITAAGAAAWAAARDAAGAAAGAAAGDAAWAAAWAAAWDAARDAARDAAGAAAWDAAGAAARAAAWAAAWDAARDAAGAAAWDALAPTVAELQESAFDLLDRMIEVGQAAETAQ